MQRLTGGCSSSFSPLSGFAFKFANTPSEPAPPPYTRPLVAVCGANTGSRVTSLTGACGRAPSAFSGFVVSSALATSGSPRISRCLSSPSFSSSESEPSASKVSAKVCCSSDRSGSLADKWRDVGDEARDRKEGGGELGIEECWVEVIGVSSSFADTYCEVSILCR